MRVPVRRLLAAVGATAVLVGAGLAVGGRSEPDRPPPTRASSPSFGTTPLGAVDTTNVTLARRSFCSAVDPREVSAALGGAPSHTSTWSTGQRVSVGPRRREVVAEFGCRYVGATGARATAWLFAPPVTPGAARRLVRMAAAAGGCGAVPGAPALGTPTVATLCHHRTVRVAAFQGLLGDAWLTCTVTIADPTVDDAVLLDRAGRWCVGVVRATSGGATI